MAVDLKKLSHSFTSHQYNYTLTTLFTYASLKTSHEDAHYFKLAGTAQQVFEWGAKEECVEENLGGGGGACLWISIQFL